MKPKFKAIIFDLDGLLIDSESSWEVSFRSFIESKSLLMAKDVEKRRVGMGLRNVILMLKKDIGLKGDTEELLNEHRDGFYKELFKPGVLNLLPGASDLVKKLAVKKLKLAVATGGHPVDKCSDILEKLGIREYFSIIVSSDNVKNGKPAPDVYLETARQLGVKCQNCLVFEDAVNGVEAGKKAGMEVWGVIEDDNNRQELKKAGADKVFASLMEVNI